MVKYYKGLNCLTDVDTELFAEYKMASQATIKWAKQSVYGLYSLYFGVVLLFLFVMRKVFYVFSDTRSRFYGSRSARVFRKPVAISRYLVYKRIPLIFSRITGLPASIGSIFLLFASTLYILCYTFIPHFYYRGCAEFGTPPLAQRSGMLVMGMTPFLIIISGKTNFISGITGVSYEKLNVFHQALGWGSLFLSLVHTIPFLVQDSLEGGAARLESRWHSRELYRNGVPPLVFLFLLCFCGLRFVRKYLYEVFWHTHWILALAYVGTLTWHIYGAMGVEYIWGSFGFWAAQMIYRTILKSPFIPNDYVFKHKNATVKALPNNLFEITVPIRNKFEFFWKPGQHLFVRFMSGVHTLDNHPFSIVTIPETSGGSTLKMMVRPHGGLTRKIYESVLKESTLEKNYKVFIDGPYGGMNRDPLAFDKLILVASGTGISVTLPFMLNVAKNLGDPSNEVQQVDFTWIIRHLDSLEWVKNQLIDLLNSILEKDEEFLSLFSINVFVTNSKDSLRPEIVKGNLHPIRSLGKEDIISNVPKLKDSSIKVNTSNFKEFVNIHHGQKPLLKDYVMSTSLLAKTAVIVSGTRSAQIDVGNAVSELQKEVIKAGSSIEEVYLHTENFGW